MKILKLRFSNLNSVYGEWIIDFTNPVYRSDGIFAITGPTGSGKTTIMDAICLALYGQTPRLGKISQGTNEIMSRKTGECFSEVEFESSKGRFKCHWSQKRSYLKPDGNLQSPRHEIADASTGDILESSKAQVLERVEDATGMDFEQFTRSIMLAQGGFAAFLEAKPAERAPVLEQITGTEIYSRISTTVFEKTKEEKNALDNLCAGIEGISLLSEDELESLKDEREEKKIRLDELSKEIKEYDRCLLWLNKIKELKSGIAGLEAEKSEISEEAQILSDDFIRLEKGKRASDLLAPFENYKNIKELAEKSRNDYETTVREIEDLNLKITDLSDKNTHAQGNLSELKLRLSEEREIIKEVFELDFRIDSETRTYSGYNQRYETLLDKKNLYEQNIQEFTKSRQDTEEQLKIHSEYLKNHEKDSEISEILGRIEEKASEFCDTKESMDDNKVRLEIIKSKKEQALLSLEEEIKVLDSKREDCKKTEIRCREVSKELSKILNEKTVDDIRNEAEILQEKIRTIQRLTEISERKIKYLNEKESVAEENGHINSNIKEELLNVKRLETEIETEERLLHELEEKKMLLLKIKNLEDERKRLEAGKPCPLCGSLTHPYSAAGTEYNAAESDLNISAQQKKITSLKETLIKIRENLAGFKEGLIRNGKRLSEIERLLFKTDEDIQKELEKSGLNPEKFREPDYFRTENELKDNLQFIKDLLLRVEDAAKTLKKAEKNHSSIKDALHDAEVLFNSIKNGFENIKKDESALLSEISEQDKRISRHIEALQNILLKFNIIFDPFTNPKTVKLILQELNLRKEEYSVNKSEEERFFRYSESRKKDIEAAEKNLKGAESEISDISGQLAVSKNTLKKYQDKRYLLYGDKDPKAEEEKICILVSEAESEAETIKGLIKSLEGSLKSKSWQKDSLETEKTRYSSTLMAKEMVFFEKLSDAGFSGIDEFNDAILSPADLSRLNSIKEEVYERKNRNEAMLSDRKQSLAKETTKILTEKAETELKREKDSLESDNNNILSEIGAIEGKFSENETQKLMQKERLEKLESQKELCRRWENLSLLIGSKDGKKFRNFAQGLTFEIMIANANRQLERMNDRYILMHSPHLPLELSVIDNYQAGEMRSTRNLSGGESFIVSLALALGLSNMASQNVRVDSLFLDEGFGTLDEDSLETALETLSGLRQDEKLIGIISHVTAIKERIPAKIEIVKRSGGRSIIKGPGCTHK